MVCRTFKPCISLLETWRDGLRLCRTERSWVREERRETMCLQEVSTGVEQGLKKKLQNNFKIDDFKNIVTK